MCPSIRPRSLLMFVSKLTTRCFLSYLLLESSTRIVSLFHGVLPYELSERNLAR